MARRSTRLSPFDDLDPPAEVPAAAPPPPRRFQEPPGVVWRLSGLPVMLAALLFAVSLASYHASDVPFLHSPAPAVSHNWTGLGGAVAAWAALQTFGFAAFAIPVAVFAAGLAMALGLRMGWRPLWAAALLPCLSATLERTSALFAGVLASERWNLAPDAGGGIGWLLHHPGSAVERWIGPAGETILSFTLLAAFLTLFIGPRSIVRRYRAAMEKRSEIRAAARERAFGDSSAVEDDEDRRRAEREEAKAAKEQAKADRIAERERRRAEREAEKAEKEAQKERIRAEREAEKARKKAEKRGKTREDALFGAEEDTPPQEDLQAPSAAQGGAVERPASPASARLAPAVQASPAAPAPAVQAPAAAPVSAPAAEAAKAESDAPAPPANPLAWESDPTAAEFELPVTRLLKPLPKETAEDNRAEIEERSRIIEDTLGQFGLKVEVVDVVCGPTITRYEVRPAPGVRVDRVSTYEHDLQMALRAKSLRIISPIPGKDVMGIEVPNLHRRAVPFRGIAESPEWKAAEQRMGIPMLLGKDIDGSPVIADLAKMPHLIVAGATGSGKSVGLNSILSGILLCRTPAQVRMILVDPKMVEFTPYADIPHLVVPVITEAPKVAVALQWAIKEMNRRLVLFKKVGVRNIVSYNNRPQERQASLFGDDGDEGADEAPPPAHIPYIVIVVDEMSDLMMLAGGDVEPRIVRLAQLARAVGIHLVIATQRPDVKTITGKIKANFPARLAFKVVSQVDSITILNSAGAETLIGNGDMLFMNPTSAAGAARAQGCWIDDDEISALTRWYRDQGPPVYVPEIKEKLDRVKVKEATGDDIKGIEDPGAPEADGGIPRTGEEADLARALAVIASSGRATISWVQRQLKVGYNRAARIIEELEERGCIGPANGTAPREILRTTLGPPPGADGSLDGDDSLDDDGATMDDEAEDGSLM